MANVRKFTDTEKWCPRCKAWLLLATFKDKPSAKGPCKKEPYCSPCMKEYDNSKKAKYRARLNAYQRTFLRCRKYNLTPEQAEEMLATQGFKCAICPEAISFETCNVDHDHTTDKVRGLLCGLCNRGLGNFKDCVQTLKQAIEYLTASHSSR